MLYFDTLPKIITPDQNGQPILLTNIMVRAKLLEELENNPMLFYQYSIQDGDTPEIIADKYYNDSYRYWIILYSNKVGDKHSPHKAQIFYKYNPPAQMQGRPRPARPPG